MGAGIIGNLEGVGGANVQTTVVEELLGAVTGLAGTFRGTSRAEIWAELAGALSSVNESREFVGG